MSGTMSSPWPPSVRARTSSTETPAAFGKEAGETGAIEHAGHADDLVRREPREFLERPDHRIERVRDADDKGVRGMLLDSGADLFHHLQIDAQEIIAAHAGLSRNAGGDDANVGPGDRRVALGSGACKLGVIAFDRRRLATDRALCLWRHPR